jgi:hypothetical protein
MGKTYTGRKGVRELQRDAKPGMRIYYVNDHANMPGQFEAQTYSTLFCTHRGGLITTQWMFAHGSDHHRKVYGKGNISAEDAVLRLGGVSTTPPPGLRELASPEPDCRDEGWGGLRRGEHLRGRLDSLELESIERMAQDAGDRREKRAAERGSSRGWF